MNSNRFHRLPLVVLALLPLAATIAAPLAAQEQNSAPQPRAEGAPRQADDLHDRRVDQSGEIVVTAVGLDQLDVLAGTSVVEGDELQRNMSGQIGEVLEALPGVSATGFTPGVSRPVLRGFSGERVRVLIDGIGTIDASNTSDDHAVAIDPLTAERIEVLRGPAVLLYGSQAIGGAVNVIDKRIPRRLPAEPLHLDGLASYDSVNDQYQLGGSLDAPLGGGFVVHASGSWRDAGDLNVPGFVASSELRADLLADAIEHEGEGELEEAAELREAAGLRGRLPNSAFESWSANAGFAFFAGASNFGAALGWYDTSYGVPARPGAGHEHAAAGGGHDHGEAVSIGLSQFRADFRGDLDLGDGFLDKLITRAAYTDYSHTEFEGEEVGTIFNVDGIEARAEVVQNPRGALRGSFGMQYYYRDFTAIGAEAFVAPNRTDQFGLFTLQEFGNGPVELEAALRYEHTSNEARTLGLACSFDAVSGALGLAYETMGGLRFGLNATRVARAPSGEELFANGPHIATQAFEIGNPNLSLEKAWGLEAYVRGRLGSAQISLAAYHSRFDNYIYLSETGAEEDGLPVFAFLQRDARYSGVEGEVSLPLLRGDDFTILGDLGGDYVRASLADGTPLPRIPPLNLIGALELQSERFDARAEVQWSASQNRVAAFENATGDYALVNASLAWKPFEGQRNLTVLFQIDNIFAAEGRRHASFTRDYVPLGGRNFRISLRASV